MATEITSQGVRKHYGPRDAEDKAPAVHRTAGAIKELVVRYNYDDLPGASEDDNLVLKIPANSFILDCYRYVEVDFNSTSGTTVVDFGLVEPDGTEVDFNGLIDSAVAADGSNAGWEVGAGVLVGASIGAEDAQVVVTPSVDDLTAGSAQVVVRYIEPYLV